MSKPYNLIHVGVLYVGLFQKVVFIKSMDLKKQIVNKIYLNYNKLGDFIQLVQVIAEEHNRLIDL